MLMCVACVFFFLFFFPFYVLLRVIAVSFFLLLPVVIRVFGRGGVCWWCVRSIGVMC